MSDWISAYDTLPENAEIVLIVHRKGIAFGRYESGQWIGHSSTRPLQTVTHWMPLPEPPKVNYCL